jgi:hypothetical protein
VKKFRIVLAEVIGLGILIAWLMWKYPELIDDIIPWVALLIAWHFTWEVLDTKLVRHAAVTLGKRVNRVAIWPIVFLIGGGISLIYWVGISKSLTRLAQLAARRVAAKSRPVSDTVNSAVAELQFTFWPVDPKHERLIDEVSLPIVDGVVTVVFSAKNVGATYGNNGQIWIQICDGCKFAAEPEGTTAPPGDPITRRKGFHSIGRGIYFDPTTLKIIPPPGAPYFTIVFKYSCEQCPTMDNERAQKLRVNLVHHQVGPTIPAVEEHHNLGRSPAPPNQPSLDILCQSLADCPSKELSKRANELASELESIVAPYYKKNKELLANLNTIPLGTPEYAEAQHRAGQTIDGERMLVMGSYRRQYHTAVIAMRMALMNRTGRHNTGMDSRYDWVGTDHGNPQQLKDIASDLREMGGEVLALRQR